MKFTTTLLLALAALLPVQAVTFQKTADGINIDHPDFKCAIIATGGQIKSFVEKRNNRELVRYSLQSGGIGKIKEIIFRDLQPMVCDYDLSAEKSADGKLVVTAVWQGTKAVFKGIRVIRKFTFDPKCSYVTVQETFQAISEAKDIFPQFHTSLNAAGLEKGNTVYSFFNANGPVNFTHQDVRRFMQQVTTDPVQPWFGYLNDDMQGGFALAFERAQNIETAFAWSDNKLMTMVANYRQVSVAPVAERDVWHTTYYLMPFQGEGKLLHASTDLIVSGRKVGKKSKVAVFLPETVDDGKVFVEANGKVLAQKDIKAGNRLYTLEFAEMPGKVKAGYRSSKSSCHTLIDGVIAAGSREKASKRLVQRKFSGGMEGAYYYYKEMYVSRDPHWTTIGLRGNFARYKDLRLRIYLPETVEIPQFIPQNNLLTGKAELDGVKMRYYEVTPWRRTTNGAAIDFSIKLNGKLPENAFMALQMRRKGWEQKPEKVKLVAVEDIPALDGRLKHFSLGMEFRRGVDSWPIEKYGFNRLMLPRKESHFFEAPVNDTFYKDTVSALAKRNISLTVSFMGPFRYFHIIRNNKTAKTALKQAGVTYLPVKKTEDIDMKDYWAVNSEGQRIAMFCPGGVTRGRYLEKTLETFKIGIDYGIDNFTTDEEHWGNGAAICFCKFCQEEFSKRQKAAGLEVVDMKTVAGNERKYPAHTELWWNMKTDQVAELYKHIRNVLDTYKPNGRKRTLSVWVDRRANPTEKVYNAIANRLSDYRKLSRYIDELLPMCYEADENIIIATTRNTSSLVDGVTCKLIMGLSPCRYYEYFRVMNQDFAPRKGFEHQILETFFNGGKGVMVWAPASGLRGAFDMRNAALAVKRTLPIEEILYFGKEVSVKCDNPAVKVTAVEYKGKIAVFLRNYSAKTVECTLDMPGNMKSAVDTLTGKKLDSLKFKFEGENRIHTLLLQ